MVARGSRPASVADVHELAMAMPHVTRTEGSQGTPVVYQVGGKSFVFFRNPRPDACDPVTGERYDDVIVFWVADEADKRSLVDDEDSPFFTTPHFDGHLSVLLRGKHVPELSLRRAGRGGPGRVARARLRKTGRAVAGCAEAGQAKPRDRSG